MATQQQQDKSQAKGSMASGITAQALEAQNRYWRDHFRNEPYYAQGQDFDVYEPAFRLGAEARSEHPNKQFTEVEDALRMQYESGQQAQRKLDWAQARQAVRAAWDRTEQVLPGNDGGKRH